MIKLFQNKNGLFDEYLEFIFINPNEQFDLQFNLSLSDQQSYKIASYMLEIYKIQNNINKDTLLYINLTLLSKNPTLLTDFQTIIEWKYEIIPKEKISKITKEFIDSNNLNNINELVNQINKSMESNKEDHKPHFNSCKKKSPLLLGLYVEKIQ